MEKRIGTLAIASALVSGIALAAFSGLGILDAQGFYGTDALRLAFLPTDIANLALGLPLTLAALLLAVRGRASGRLLLSGAFVYGFYVCLPYAVVMPTGFQRILAVLVMASSLAGILSLLSPGRKDFAADLPERLPLRFPAAVLLGLGLLFLARQAVQVAATLGKAQAAPAADIALWIADLAFMVPLMIAAGLSLWRRGSFGLAFGPGILAAYAALSLGLVPWFLFQAAAKGNPVDIGGIVVVVFMAFLCIVPLALFLAALGRRPAEC